MPLRTLCHAPELRSKRPLAVEPAELHHLARSSPSGPRLSPGWPLSRRPHTTHLARFGPRPWLGRCCQHHPPHGHRAKSLSWPCRRREPHSQEGLCPVRGGHCRGQSTPRDCSQPTGSLWGGKQPRRGRTQVKPFFPEAPAPSGIRGKRVKTHNPASCSAMPGERCLANDTVVPSSTPFLLLSEPGDQHAGSASHTSPALELHEALGKGLSSGHSFGPFRSPPGRLTPLWSVLHTRLVSKTPLDGKALQPKAAVPSSRQIRSNRER